MSGRLWSTPPRRYGNFERRAERHIIEATNRLLTDLHTAAQKEYITDEEVRAACERFSGPDLADCWDNFIIDFRGQTP